MQLHQLSLTELNRLLNKRQISSIELTEHFLKRIHEQSDLNAFITITDELALDQAQQADNRIANEQAGTLTGIPIAHKDLFCSQNVLTSCGSRILENFISPYNATLVEKINDAGMVTLGKTNMDEFAMGSSNENSYYGPVKNPWNTARVPGGSSGGSACAVAARLAPVATGTDTGGSIRQPAAFCGLTGIKPSYGRVSRYGMVAFASSLDQAGVFAKNAQDASLLLKQMAGFDALDSTSINQSVPDYFSLLNQQLSGRTIGLPKEYFSEGLDSEIANSIEQAVKVFQSLGIHLKEISLPKSTMAIPCYYVIAPAEASSNLSRFDGVRYGYRSEQAENLIEMYQNSRSEGFGEEVKRRIMIGTYVLSAGYYDAYYRKAQRLRRLISEDFSNAFEQCDFILGPTTPTTAFELNSKVDDPVSMYLNDIYTISANLAGLPGISTPCGFDQSGLPIGMQLIGQYFDEASLLAMAHQYQLNTDWHQHTPQDTQP